MEHSYLTEESYICEKWVKTSTSLLNILFIEMNEGGVGFCDYVVFFCVRNL